MANWPYLRVSSIMAVLMICGAVLTDAAAIAPAPWTPWQGEGIPPQPRKGFYVFLTRCEHILTDECGMQVYDYTFLRRTDITDNCCINLVKMGKLCNIAMAYSLSRLNKYKRWRGHIYQKSIEAYDICAKRKQSP